MFFMLIKKGFNIKNDENENKWKIENSVLLQEKQQGSEVLKLRRVTQQETSVGIRSSELVNSEVLQDTSEGKGTKVLDWYTLKSCKKR